MSLEKHDRFERLRRYDFKNRPHNQAATDYVVVKGIARKDRRGMNHLLLAITLGFIIGLVGGLLVRI